MSARPRPEPPLVPGICATCRRRPAACLAARPSAPDDTWPCCDGCRDQARRLHADVDHQPLTTSEAS